MPLHYQKYFYNTNKNHLDFGVILNNPLLWLGNEQLVNFTGENIFKWMRMEDDVDGIRFKNLAEKNNDKYSIKEQLQALLYKKENSLFGIHLSAIGLSSKNFDIGFNLLSSSSPLNRNPKINVQSILCDRLYVLFNRT